MSGYFICPHCEAKVPSKARACPECGSDENTGWASAPDDDPLLSDNAEEIDTSTAKGWPNSLIAILSTLTLASFVVYALSWGMYLIPILLLLVGLLFYVSRRLPNRGSSVERELYQTLLDKAHGDAELVARLIEYERRRDPEAPRVQLLRDAIYRWQRGR